MNRKYFILNLSVAALLGASSLSFAATPYTVTPVAGTAIALSQAGNVLGYTVDADGNPAYFLTGPNASGFTAEPGLTPTFPNYNQPVAINNAGTIALNVYGTYDNNGYGVGIVRNGSSSTEVLGTITGLNASGAVVYNDPNQAVVSWTGRNIIPPGAVPGGTFTSSGTDFITAPSHEVSASGINVTISDLGYGSTAAALNDAGQVTGSVYTSAAGSYETIQENLGSTVVGVWNLQTTNSFNTRAIRTGANASGLTVFGTANGLSSTGLAINNAGQVGGYLTLAGGQTEAFISSAHGSLLVGIGAGSTGDSTQVDFLNGLGQAIVQDTSTGLWYLYSAGSVVPLTSLGSVAGDTVVGFNDAGQILLQDPQLLSPLTAQVDLQGLNGVISVADTDSYMAVASAEGVAPTAAFFSTLR